MMPQQKHSLVYKMFEAEKHSLSKGDLDGKLSTRKHYIISFKQKRNEGQSVQQFVKKYSSNVAVLFLILFRDSRGRRRGLPKVYRIY